jgi:hypothetical protein
MSLSVVELMGLVRPPKRVAPSVAIVEGELRKVVRRKAGPRTKEQRAKWERTYIANNREKYLAMRRRQQKRRYWANVEKSRATKRATQKNKADYTPEQWAHRLVQLRVAAAKSREKRKAA